MNDPFQSGVHSSRDHPYLHTDYRDNLEGPKDHIQLDRSASEFMAQRRDIELKRTDTSVPLEGWFEQVDPINYSQ